MFAEFKKGEKHGFTDADLSDNLETFSDGGYVLTENDLVVDIDCLDHKQIEQMIKRFNIKTHMVWTTRGIHLYFKKPDNFRDAQSITALGIAVEYKHLKNTKAVTVKLGGISRKVENEGVREDLPNYLKSNRKCKDILGLEDGEGRNKALFDHRCIISNLNNWNQIILFINQVIFAIPLPDKELETICRDIVIEAVKDGEAFMADNIMNERKIVRYNQQLYYSENGEFIGDDDYLKRLVFGYCQGQKTYYVDEVIKQMEYRAHIITNHKPFDIKFKNGILRNGEFIEVEYTEFTPYSINVKVDLETAPVKVVDDYLDHLTESDPEYKDRLMEILGHCLIVNKEFKRLMGKFFIFVGNGGNGKGTFLAVVRAILNSKNCSGLSVKNMSDERYLNVLQGKLVNLGDDIHDEPIDNEQMKMLKNISTCDFVEIRKLYKNANSVELTPSLIFTSNHMIKSFEKGESYKRRVDWLPMFGMPKHKTKNFISLLTSEEALQYWVKLMVEGYMRLYKNQAFTECEKVSDYNKKYHEENNSIILFVNNLEIADIINKKIPEIYDPYCLWAEENGDKPLSKRLLTSTIYDIHGLVTGNKTINKVSYKVYILTDLGKSV